ncbi:MAG TPA: hypothetical protein VFP61_05950 [Acidimicrobiales bacterium]|nr:hypothetical protein [Acidimicrobiales bacterium]
MTVEKVTVSLDPAVAQRARREVAAGRARSLSEWLNEVARARLDSDDLAGILEGIFADTGGPPTDDELDRARRRLQHARRG